MHIIHACFTLSITVSISIISFNNDGSADYAATEDFNGVDLTVF